jgi:tetratricopeptide (TPR) repeat protein
VREGLLASGVAHASDSGARVGAALDRHADALAEAWHATCLDGDVHRTWSSSDVALANWCLEERRTELAALVDELAGADAGVAHGAVVAATRLGRVEPCRDRDALQRAPQPPAAQLDEVLAVRTALASERVRAFVDRREPERLAVVQTLRERAEALAWPPLTARARAFEAKLLARNGDDIGAEREGIAAYFEASRAGAWDVAALAAMQLVALLGDKLGRLDEALVWGEHGRTALAHGGDTDGVLDALLTRGIGKVYARQGRHDEARASAAEYLAHVERVFGPEHPSIVPALDELAVAEGLTDDLDAALALHERAVAAGERTLGATHPHLVKPIANLATACLDRGDVSRARALFERALAGATENGPEGALWNNAANADMVAGDLPAARAKYERAREIFVRTWGPDHAAVGATLMNLAGIHRRLGEIETAHRLLAESRSILEQRLGPDHADVGVVLAQQGEIAGLRGERALARDYFERAVDIHARALGTRHHTYAQSVAQLGRWHADAGDTERARALLAQSVAVFADHEGLQQGEAEAREQLAALD